MKIRSPTYIIITKSNHLFFIAQAFPMLTKNFQSVPGGPEMMGVIFIIAAWIIGKISGIFRRIPNRKITTGIIIALEHGEVFQSGPRMYTAVVSYRVDGKEYLVRSRYKSSSFRTGRKRCVAYNEAFPQQAMIAPGITAYLITIGLGLAGAASCCLAVMK